MLGRTRFGRYVYAVGGNAEAARRAGINVDRIKIAVFAICSLMAAVGGIMLASRLRSVDTNAGGGSILLYSIAAAVIGGTSLFGGRGHIKSALLGALVIASIDNGLGLLGPGLGREVRDHRRRAAAGGHGRLALAPRPRRTPDERDRQSRVRHRRQPGRRRRRRARVRTTTGCGWRCASRSGDDLGLEALGLTATCATRRRSRRAVARRSTRFGRLDVVVANAGVGSYGPFLELDPDDVEAMIDVNLKGTLYTARSRSRT